MDILKDIAAMRVQLEAVGMREPIAVALLSSFVRRGGAEAAKFHEDSRYELETHLAVLQTLTGRMLETRREWDALRIDEATRLVEIQSLRKSRDIVSARLNDPALGDKRRAIDEQRVAIERRLVAMEAKRGQLLSIVAMLDSGFRNINKRAMTEAAADASARLSPHHNDGINHGDVGFPIAVGNVTLLRLIREAAGHFSDEIDWRDKTHLNASIKDVEAALAGLLTERAENAARLSALNAEVQEWNLNLQKLEVEINGKTAVLESGRNYDDRMNALLLLFQRDRVEVARRSRAAASALDHFYGWYVPPPAIDDDALEIDLMVIWVREAVAAHNAAAATDRAATLRMQCYGQEFETLATRAGEVVTFSMEPNSGVERRVGARIVWVRVNLVPRAGQAPLGSFEVKVSTPTHAYWTKTEMVEVRVPPRALPRLDSPIGAILVDLRTGEKNPAYRTQLANLSVLERPRPPHPGLPSPRPGLPLPNPPGGISAPNTPSRTQPVAKSSVIAQQVVVRLTPVVPRSSFSEMARTTSQALVNRCPFGVKRDLAAPIWAGDMRPDEGSDFKLIQHLRPNVGENVRPQWLVEVSKASSIGEELVQVCQGVELEVGYLT